MESKSIKAPIAKLTHLQEGFCFPLPVTIMILLMIISGEGKVPLNHWFISILTPSSIALAVWILIRMKFLGKGMKLLKRGNLTPEEAKKNEN